MKLYNSNMSTKNKLPDSDSRQAKIIVLLHESGLSYNDIGDIIECEGSTLWRIRKGKITNTRVNIADGLENLAHQFRLKIHVT